MNYTEEQKEYILSKVTDINWEDMPKSIKDFWVNYKNVK